MFSHAIAESNSKSTEENDSFLNIKCVHERNNGYAFGEKNTSAFALNPVITLGDFTLEGDVYYGRQYTFTPFLKGNGTFFKETKYIAASLGLPHVMERLNSASQNALEEAHFYRNYTRIVYGDKKGDFRLVIGDTMTRNTIGFQRALSGAGISIFRQSGNGNVINGGSSIVITRLSKIECKLGKQIIALKLFKPGIYSISDLPEEAKLPGVTVKISDQLSRSEVLNVDYFGGYGMPEAGKDDFDITVVCNHLWELDDPHRLKYQKKPRLSTNYRYGYSDDVTLGIGGQAHENCYTLDATVIFSGEFGKISPNIAFSDSNSGNKNRTVGAGIFYSLPKNELGIFLEAFFAVKGNGFGDLGKIDDENRELSRLENKYFQSLRPLSIPQNDSSSRQITARLYTRPIYNITPGFIFNGEWSKNQRLREYTLSFTTTFCNCCSFTVASGLTYDDPLWGRNQQSPDRRLTVACAIDLCSELSFEGSYVYYAGEKRRSYGSITYTPEEIKGLEFCGEFTRRPGLSTPCFSVKYDANFFNIKVEQSVINTYEDKEAATSNDHSNKQRIFFETSLSANGLGQYKNSGFNTLRK
jgi:hypothetical protein